MKSNKLSKFLLQPYPFYYSGKFVVVIAGIIYLMTFFFNYFFKPFNINVSEHRFDFFWICNLHAFVSVVVFLSIIFIFKLNARIDESWNILRELLFLAILLLMIGVGQFLIRDIIYINPNNWSLTYFFEEIRNTFLVGILFTLIIVPLNFNRLYVHNFKKANSIKIKGKQKSIALKPTVIFIETQVKDEAFQLEVANFQFAKADGNYLEIHLNNEGKTEKLFKRISIKNLFAKLSSYPFIIKTHRSYLVNTFKVEKVTGNAQGYRLRIKGHADVIPVSRKMIPFFEEKMKKLNS